MRIAHLSDVHVLDLEGVRFWRFFNKRLTGLANLMGRRRGAHPTELLERLVAGLVADPVDHVVITGDLTNLSLESELARAREAIAPLGGRDRLSVIPGNHDVYTRGAARARRFEAYFGDLMWGEGDEREYPWYKDLGPVALLGFSSAIATPPLFAHGRVGDAQLERLTAVARRARSSERYCVGLVHHNLHPRGTRKDRMHGLRDREALIAGCQAAHVDLLLHGHTHVAHRFERGGLDVIGCGSSTWNSEDPAHTARYNVYRIEDGRLAETEVRIYDFERERFVARPPQG